MPSSIGSTFCRLSGGTSVGPVVEVSGVLQVSTAADHVGPGEAVVEVVAGVALPGQAMGVELGLGRPGAFRQIDAVVFQDRALAVMDLGDAALIVGQRAEVGHFGVGPLPLGIEQQVERDGFGFERRPHRFHLLLGRHATVEVGLARL